MPIVRERQDNVELNCVMSNSFGFGGTNATLVFRRATRRLTALSTVAAEESLSRREARTCELSGTEAAGFELASHI